MTVWSTNSGEILLAGLSDTLTLLKATLDIHAVIEEMKGILTHTWKESSRQIIIDSIKRLQSISGALTQDELETIRANIEQALGISYAEAVNAKLVDLHKAAYLMGMNAANAKAAGVSIAWGLDDQKSLDALSQNTRFWVRNHFNDQVNDKINDVLQGFFRGGQDRVTVIDNLKNAFAGVLEQSDKYWDLLADHTCTKVREIGRVSGYEQADIEYVQFRARIDARTSKICRAMHGRIIPVKNMRRQVDEYFKACVTEDKDKIKASWPWVNDSKAGKMAGMKTKEIIAEKVSLPPLHARCRSITVAWFEPETHAQLDYGNGISSAARKTIGAYSAEEHRNFIDDAKRLADTLEYAPKHFTDDFQKWELAKHVQRKKEFGDRVRIQSQYLEHARDALRNADTVLVKDHRGDLQYEFYDSSGRCYAVLDRGMTIVGCYGQGTTEDFHKCLNNRMLNKARLD